MTDPADLRQRILARIQSDGPLTIAAYMADALYDQRAGYYATKDPIGAGGDFVTAPEISQMFGELIGLWCLSTWLEMGAPKSLRLIELGPGRGSLMADALRAARVRDDFLAALKVTLVEVSPALQAAQAETLSSAPVVVEYAPELPTTGAEPAIIIANEFLDCLPIRQFVKLEGAWRERLVGQHPEDPGALAFVFDPAPAAAPDLALIPSHLVDADEGTLVEVRPADARIAEACAARLNRHGGRAVFIDYGPAEATGGDTLQAVRAHEKVSPLADPGQADLTARVDFGAFARAAIAAGLDVAGPKEQGQWLVDLGVQHRAIALMAAEEDKKHAIATQVFRLTDASQMGALFKAMCLSPAGSPPPPGF